MDSLGSVISSFLSNFRDSRYYKLLFLLPIVLGASLLFTEYVVSVSLVMASMLMSFLVRKTGTKTFGAELFTFATVIIAASFGGVIGGFVGLFLILFHVAAVQLKGPYLTWVVPSYFVAGLLVPFLGSYGIFMTGMIVTVGLHVFYTLMTAVVTPRGLANFLPYSATNIAFNFVVFKFLAPVIVTMI